MMRVTNNMMVSNLLQNLEKNLNSMTRKQDELATGKKVLRASDDPIAASKILKFKTDISELAQFQDNGTDALGWLEATESSIADSGEVLHRLKELSVQASNGTYSTEDLSKIRTEVQQLKKQLITNGNFNFAGRYVFSGFQTDKPLFNSDGTFNVDLTSYDLNNVAKTKFLIGVGEDLEISSNGLDLFGYVPSTSIMAQRFPDGVSEGSAATKAVIKSTVNPDLNADLTTGLTHNAGMVVRVNGVDFTVDPLKLNSFKGSGVEADKAVLTDIISTATNGTTKLNQVADVFFDSSGKLSIKNKSYGTASTLNVQYSAATGGVPSIPDLEATFGIPNGTTVSGVDAIDTSVTGSVDILSGDIAANLTDIENKSFYMTVNGETKKITVGVLGSSDQAGLTTALNTALSAAFGNQVVASFATNRLVFTTSNQANDGHIPRLESRPIQTTESQLIADINKLDAALAINDKAGITTFLADVSVHHNRIMESRSEIGAKTNRLDLIIQRITDNNVSFSRMLSDEEDADVGEVIMNLKNAENVYKSALSTGARVIQPTLIDFLR